MLGKVLYIIYIIDKAVYIGIGWVLSLLKFRDNVSHEVRYLSGILNILALPIFRIIGNGIDSN